MTTKKVNDFMDRVGKGLFILASPIWIPGFCLLWLIGYFWKFMPKRFRSILEDEEKKECDQL